MDNDATSLYDDEYKWALETAAAVRAGNFDAIDRDLLVSELERSIAGGFKRQLYEHIRDALRARLSLNLSPETGRPENEDLLRNALEGINSLLWACPSLRDLVTEEFVAKAYQGARYILGDEFPLPELCPYSAQQVLMEADTLGA
jgi:hypothetical protein